jgi:hypothetical protein
MLVRVIRRCEAKEVILAHDGFYYTCNGKILDLEKSLSEGLYRIVRKVRLRGDYELMEKNRRVLWKILMKLFRAMDLNIKSKEGDEVIMAFKNPKIQ